MVWSNIEHSCFLTGLGERPLLLLLLLYWGSSWESHEVFQPKMLYYSKMGTYSMNSGMTFTYMLNQESLFIHNLAFKIALVGHGQGFVHSTCLTWDFLITYHMFLHEVLGVCTAILPHYLSHVPSWSFRGVYHTDDQLRYQYASPAIWIWTMGMSILGFCPSTQYNGPFRSAN